MGFFRRLNNGFARFMYGRNGVDQLNQATLYFFLILCVVRAVISAFFGSFFAARLMVRILDYVLLVLFVLILFRMFSKNLPKRRAENMKWVNFCYKVKNRRSGAKARHADKDHRYFTCKTCRTICRVPVGKGKIIITCPKCGTQINAKT